MSMIGLAGLILVIEEVRLRNGHPPAPQNPFRATAERRPNGALPQADMEITIPTR